MDFGEWFAFVGPAYLVAVAVPLARIDLKQHRLPNRLVLPAVPITLLGQGASASITGEWSRLGQALLAMTVAFVIGVLLNRFASLGMGDVKLIAAASLMLGWFGPVWPLVAVCLAFTLASLIVLPKVLLRRLSLKRSMALGPYLLVGIIGVFGVLPFI